MRLPPVDMSSAFQANLDLLERSAPRALIEMRPLIQIAALVAKSPEGIETPPALADELSREEDSIRCAIHCSTHSDYTNTFS
jgi:hypothetical protein